MKHLRSSRWVAAPLSPRGSGCIQVLALLALACSPSPQDPLSLQLHGASTDGSRIDLPDGTRLTLVQARLAFGPLVFCPGTQSGALCDTALLEWRDAAVVDLLQTEPSFIGEVFGNTGTVRSYMYDLGYVSLLTQSAPLALPASQQLGDASLLIVGQAQTSSAAAPRPFTVKLAARPSTDVDRGQPVVRLSSPPGLPVTLSAEVRQVLLRFPVASWFAGLDESAFVVDEPCAGQVLVCHGDVQEICSTGELVDCSEQDQVCAPEQGCQNEVDLTEGTRAGRKILQRLVAGSPPDLVWQ